MKEEFLKHLLANHQQAEYFPASKKICEFTTDVLKVLFPALAEKSYNSTDALNDDLEKLKERLVTLFKSVNEEVRINSDQLANEFMGRLPEVYDWLRTDIAAIVKGDPAARNEFEVVRTYPGFYAIAMYRLAHEFFKLKIPVLPRIITEFAHSHTGIDIHPGAVIASHFCIDHGTGIVIGETTIIGKYVKLYQGVTLGALSVDKSMAESKRHPTLEDSVVIYSGATILGGNTIIGHHSIIGGNVWLTKSVPPYSTVYYKAQIEVGQDKLRSDLPKI